MAKKKVTKVIKLQIPAGKATPAPPIGPALGAAGANIMAFCRDFNAKTQGQAGDVLPVVITVYSDKSIDFITKQPPTANLIKKELNIQTGSKAPNREKVGRLTLAQAQQIAERKRVDMEVNSLEAAIRNVCGAARSMGVDIVEV